MNPNQKRHIPEVEGTQPDGTTWKRLTNGRMVLLRRRPEWDAQEMLDHRRYLYDATYTLNELEEMEAIEGPETSEHGFRRGMGEGWKIAVETVRDLVNEGMSLEEALHAMGRFLREGRLAAWHAGNCAQYERPPELFAEEAWTLLTPPDQAEDDGEG